MGSRRRQNNDGALQTPAFSYCSYLYPCLDNDVAHGIVHINVVLLCNDAYMPNETTLEITMNNGSHLLRYMSISRRRDKCAHADYSERDILLRGQGSLQSKSAYRAGQVRKSWANWFYPLCLRDVVLRSAAMHSTIAVETVGSVINCAPSLIGLGRIRQKKLCNTANIQIN